MIKPKEDWKKTFYHSARWEHTKRIVMRRDGYKDKVAARYGKMIPAELVHHIIPLDEAPDLALDLHNLIAVSQATHNRLHNPDGSLSLLGKNLRRFAIYKYYQHKDFLKSET